MAVEFIWSKVFEDDERFWTGKFIDNGEVIDDISLSKYDNDNFFLVSWCHGWSMRNNLPVLEFTLDKAKKWCEEWILKRHIVNYENIVENLASLKRCAEFAAEHLGQTLNDNFKLGDVCVYAYEKDAPNKSCSIVRINKFPKDGVAEVSFRYIVNDDSGNGIFTYLYDKNKPMNVSTKYLTVIYREEQESQK